MKIQQWLFEFLRKKHYIKSHLELQREITLIELALALTFLSKVFVLHIWTCLQGLMKIQQWLFELLRKQSVTDGRTDNVKTVYPLQTKFAGGITMTGICYDLNDTKVEYGV